MGKKPDKKKDKKTTKKKTKKKAKKRTGTKKAAKKKTKRATKKKTKKKAKKRTGTKKEKINSQGKEKIRGKEKSREEKKREVKEKARGGRKMEKESQKLEEDKEMKNKEINKGIDQEMNEEEEDANRKEKKPKSWWRKFLTLIVILAVLLTGYYYFYSPQQDQASQMTGLIVAKVNEEEITLTEVEKHYQQYEAYYQNKGEALNSSITTILLEQEAKKRGLEVTKEEIETLIEENLAQTGMSREELDELLSVQGISYEGFIENTRRTMLVNKLLEEELFSHITVEEEEVETFYEENEDYFEQENRTYEQSREEIEELLRERKKQEIIMGGAVQVYVGRLEKEANVTLYTDKLYSCAEKQGLENKLVFYYAEGSSRSEKMKEVMRTIESENPEIIIDWWKAGTESTKTNQEKLEKCYKLDWKRVPQLICLRTGTSLIGEAPEKEAIKLVQNCN